MGAGAGLRRGGGHVRSPPLAEINSGRFPAW